LTINSISGLDWSQSTSSVVQKRNAGQQSAGFDLDAPGADTANISSAAKKLTLQNDDRGFSVQTTLTAGDKQMMKDTTGWDIDKDPTGAKASEAAKDFAGRLNLDRYTLSKYGSADGFTGQVDQAYLQHMIQEQLGGQGMVPVSLLYKVQSYLATQEKPQ
jgi:hypothetical protein